MPSKKPSLPDCTSRLGPEILMSRRGKTLRRGMRRALECDQLGGRTYMNGMPIRSAAQWFFDLARLRNVSADDD